MHRPAPQNHAAPGAHHAPGLTAEPPADPAPDTTAVPVPATGRAFAAVVVANVALAFGPWLVRIADTGPVAAAFWRIALAAPLLSLMALGAGARPRRLGTGLGAMLAVSGVAFAADLGSWHLGILRTTLANSTLFGNTATIFFPLYGFLAARAWPTRSQALALGLAAVGAGLLMGRSYSLDPRHLAGDVLCLTAGVLYTTYLILMARARATMAPLSSLALSTWASVVPLWAFAMLMGERVLPGAWWPVIALALVSQVLGQGCMIYALGRLSPLAMGIALLIQPIVAGTIGWVIYGERLQAADWIGVVLVAAALVLVRRPERVARAAAGPKDGGA